MDLSAVVAKSAMNALGFMSVSSHRKICSQYFILTCIQTCPVIIFFLFKHFVSFVKMFHLRRHVPVSLQSLTFVYIHGYRASTVQWLLVIFVLP